MLIGYARVSRSDQHLDAQLDALERAGCERVFSERVSAVAKREQYARLFEHARPGDVVVVVRLDRLGRRMHELIATIHELNERGVHVRALAQGIDTSTSAGTLLVGVFAALAETERTLLLERTREGLAAARERGRTFGRPRRLSPAKATLAASLRAEGHSVREIAQALQLSETSVRRALQVANEKKSRDIRQLQLEPK